MNMKNISLFGVETGSIARELQFSDFKMDSLWSYMRKLDAMQMLLIALIVVFFLSILLFVFLTLTSRVKKLKREVWRKKNTPHINKILFSIAFDGATIEDVKKDREFTRNWKRRFYRQQFLDELIKLHQLYEGKIARNLRRCYTDSRLIQLSYEKIRRRKWEVKCMGIQELSEMEIKKAVPVILEHTKSRNETLKMVALIEVIHLSGLEGISLLKNYEEPLNDWIQLNVLESIKETHSADVPDFGYLLQSENESIVVFGLRLLKMFHQNQHLSTVKKLQNSPSRRINQQAITTYDQLVKTAGEKIPEKGDEPQEMFENISKPEQKESFNPNILIIVISSFLLILAVVTFIMLGSFD